MSDVDAGTVTARRLCQVERITICDQILRVSSPSIARGGSKA